MSTEHSLTENCEKFFDLSAAVLMANILWDSKTCTSILEIPEAQTRKGWQISTKFLLREVQKC